MPAASDPVVIVSAVRTPLGRFQGALSAVPAHALGAHAIRAALDRAALDPDRIDEVLMGCVLSAGQGQAPARQAARGAGLPDAAGATTVNKVCGSGMKAAMLAHDLIHAGSADVVVAGGMESMSSAPYLLAKARSGYRVGHDRLLDHMMLDGLEDAYEGGRPMGDFGEATAETYGFTRDDQDVCAAETLARARDAGERGAFTAEIAPVAVLEKAGERAVMQDGIPLRLSPDRIPHLKPAFRATGTITAAAASANADGAAALVEIRYDDFLADPLTQLERVYDVLGLGSFSDAMPAFAAYLAQVRGFPRRKHALTAEEASSVAVAWRFAFDRWTYPRRN